MGDNDKQAKTIVANNVRRSTVPPWTSARILPESATHWKAGTHPASVVRMHRAYGAIDGSIKVAPHLRPADLFYARTGASWSSRPHAPIGLRTARLPRAANRQQFQTDCWRLGFRLDQTSGEGTSCG